jgi:hypothetical protein
MVVAFIDCPIFDGGNCVISEPGNWGDRGKGPCEAFEEVFSGRIAAGVCNTMAAATILIHKQVCCLWFGAYCV